MNLVRGKLIGHARGFAFVVPDEKKTGDDDLFIPPTELNGALHGDTVLYALVPNRVVRVKKVQLYAF